MKNLVISFFILTILSCKTNVPKPTETLREKDPNSEFTSCALIEKTSINKGGKITEYKELYLQCSIQDYFIKRTSPD